MHELAATRGILDTALEVARDAGADRITIIDVVIGDLSSMVDDSVQFYFDVLSRDTLAEGARLRMRRVSATASCAVCGAHYGVTPPLDPQCEKCGALALAISGGREFHIDSIEVDP